MSCGREKALVGEAPYMVSKGFYFDGTPCMDIDSVNSPNKTAFHMYVFI
jgi:hypothetical protein